MSYEIGSTLGHLLVERNSELLRFLLFQDHELLDFFFTKHCDLLLQIVQKVQYSLAVLGHLCLK